MEVGHVNAPGRSTEEFSVMKRNPDSIRENIEEFRKQLEEGSIQKAYRALFSFLAGLRTHFVNKYGASAVSGLYQGYLDMSYFALFPPALKRRGLKVAIVFNYDAFRFEAWLSARNRKVQRQYWELLGNRRWSGYRVVAPAAGIDSILECDLAGGAGGFDLSHPDALISRIENATAVFIDDIEKSLAQSANTER
jgi:hypothetical protein